MKNVLPLEPMRARRNKFFAEARRHIHEALHPDGTARIPAFDPPHREALWVLPALYTGDPEHIALANRVAGRWFDPSKVNPDASREKTGREFGIFQSNTLAHCLHRFGTLLTPEARQVMVWHTEQVFQMHKGSAQPDYKFHGANDNMPSMATAGLILGGEALANAAAIRHGVWNLHQFRRLLSRSAWASEFNSSTYSAVTLSSMAKIATFAHDAQTRQLAQDVEARLWAEILLHYHPGTFMQAGPQSRAYSVDLNGHTHSVQVMLWMAFGDQATGRDPINSFWHSDGLELIHKMGRFPPSVTGFTDLLDTDLHIPVELAELVHQRRYPAILRGRSESMPRLDECSGAYHTETWMEPDFSLGTVNLPMGGGEQTSSLHITYRRTPTPTSFRDAASVFCKYLTSAAIFGEKETSAAEGYGGETHVVNQGWFYALQRQNVGILLSTPNLKNTPLQTDTLKLCVVFPAHYGSIARSIMGTDGVQSGAVGESADVAAVSVEVGQVYIHIQPLLPTSLPRRAAVRWVRHNRYEVLELINYEGPKRRFSRSACARLLNGAVISVSSRSDYPTLEAFHAKMSAGKVQDYLLGPQRFVLFQRDDVEFEVVLTTDHVGAQIEAVNGRTVPRPVFESNQIDVGQLPFMTGEVPRNPMFFPWPNLDLLYYPELAWMIGSRGLPGEAAYSQRRESPVKNE